MTTYDTITEIIVAKKATKNSGRRFLTTMAVGMTIVAIILAMNGWTILDESLVNPWLNVGFSALMIVSGGIAVFAIDQVVLSLQISDFEKRRLNSFEDFWKESRKKE